MQDVLDDRFTSPEEMTAQLSVPVLAMVRELEPIDGVGLATVHTHVYPTEVEAEAFRTLRTALTLSADVSDRLLVSSAEPGDGKTTVCVNLAVSFAQAGKRTLIIDADLRKPGMTTRFDLKRCPGLGASAGGRRAPAEAAPALVTAPELENLDVLPAGVRQTNPLELLSGPRLGGGVGLGRVLLRPRAGRLPAGAGGERRANRRPAGRWGDSRRAAGEKSPPAGRAGVREFQRHRLYGVGGRGQQPLGDRQRRLRLWVRLRLRLRLRTGAGRRLPTATSP